MALQILVSEILREGGREERGRDLFKQITLISLI
jgi:hypothetical protein